MNLFGIGPKGIFWLRLCSNLSQATVVVGLLADVAKLSGGKWVVGGIAVAGLVLNAVATGNPVLTK